MMKRILSFCMTVMLCLGMCICLSGCGSAEDYEKIETVRAEIAKIAAGSAMSDFDDRGKWYVYDLRLMKSKNDELFKQLKADLGEDFDCLLSNGDPLFFGVLPFRGSWRLYAGTPDDQHMLYPDWTYAALDAPD